MSQSTKNTALKERSRQSYLVGPILRACEVLKAFRFEGECIPLKELVLRTGLNKTTAFRAAQSLVEGGLLIRVAGDQYRSLVTPARRTKQRIGYAAMAANSLFSRAVSESIRLEASVRGIELVELDNNLSGRTAIRNCERLVSDGVDVAIEFQVCQEVAPVIASKFSDAQIPLVAIHTPHPGATFFGGNNYAAGRMGGRALGQWAVDHWGGKVDSILLLGHSTAGPLTQSRLTGLTVGITETLGQFDSALVFNLDCKGGYLEALEAVWKHLTRSTAKRSLVGCINDAVALGALRAFGEAGRMEHCAVMGQNATIAARAEIRNPSTRLIGSVAFFPERYGTHLIPLAMDIAGGKPVPPAVFVKHALITPRNVDHYYPNDVLSVAPDTDSMLFGRYH
jgi:ribose transport system substrate-binding protein